MDCPVPVCMPYRDCCHHRHHRNIFETKKFNLEQQNNNFTSTLTRLLFFLSVCPDRTATYSHSQTIALPSMCSRASLIPVDWFWTMELVGHLMNSVEARLNIHEIHPISAVAVCPCWIHPHNRCGNSFRRRVLFNFRRNVEFSLNVKKEIKAALFIIPKIASVITTVKFVDVCEMVCMVSNVSNTATWSRQVARIRWETEFLWFFF